AIRHLDFQGADTPGSTSRAHVSSALRKDVRYAPDRTARANIRRESRSLQDTDPAPKACAVRRTETDSRRKRSEHPAPPAAHPIYPAQITLTEQPKTPVA